MLKKIFFFLSLVLSFNFYVAYSSNVSIIGKNKGVQINDRKNLEQQLQQLTGKYRVNIDIIVLGKDKYNCYKELNYIECINKKYKPMTHYLWVINNGIKEETGRGDVDSWISNNVIPYRNVLSEQDLRGFQERTIDSLKRGNYEKAINIFITSLEKHLFDQCNKYGAKDNCTIQFLSEKKQEEIRQKQINYIKNIFIIIITFVITVYVLYILYKTIRRKIQIKKLRKKATGLINDLDYIKIAISEEKTILKEDALAISEEINKLIAEIEFYLARNENQTKKELDKFVDIYNKIKMKINESKIDKKDIEEVKQEIKQIDNLEF